MSLYMNATAAVLNSGKTGPRGKSDKSGQPAPQGPVRPALPLEKAEQYAMRIGEWISPHCRQVEPVGNLRRRCATCETIDLLVIPRFQANANLLFDFLDDYVQNEPMGMAFWRHATGRADLRGTRPGHYDEEVTLYLPKCTLVLHVASPENWFLRLFESTGSCAHVASIMQRVRSLPGVWEPGEVIRVRNATIRPLSEGHIYDVLNMSLVPPWKRVE